MPRHSGWEGPIPPEIAKCSDRWVIERFKKLCREAEDVLYMRNGEARTKQEKRLNEALASLILEARRHNEKESSRA